MPSPPFSIVESDKSRLQEVLLESEPALQALPVADQITQDEDAAAKKTRGRQSFLDVPGRNFSRLSFDSTASESVAGASLLGVPLSRNVSRSPARPLTWKEKCQTTWRRNKGLVLVLLSQFFGALMNVTTRLLETDGEGMHPLQILFARMSITAVLCCIYMWYKSIPDFPFGKREVRGLLVARGLGGFFGVYGLYYSILYLPIAEATVLTFLAPIVACWACSVLINEPFTRMEQMAGIVSLFGVVLIARPATIISGLSGTTKASGSVDGVVSTNGTHTTQSHDLNQVTVAQRLSAVGIAMVGVLGAASAYTTIRWIGKRAHPLISVNYFGVLCSIVSFVLLLVLPNISFKLPASALQWAYLIFLGTCGFCMQFLLTAGLQYEKSSRATNMVYTQMLFALAFDKLVWGTSPGIVSILGSSLILGSALYVAIQKDTQGNKKKGAHEARTDEERGLVQGMDASDEAEDFDGLQGNSGHMRGVQEVQLRAVRV